MGENTFLWQNPSKKTLFPGRIIISRHILSFFIINLKCHIFHKRNKIVIQEKIKIKKNVGVKSLFMGKIPFNREKIPLKTKRKLFSWYKKKMCMIFIHFLWDNNTKTIFSAIYFLYCITKNLNETIATNKTKRVI